MRLYSPPRCVQAVCLIFVLGLCGCSKPSARTLAFTHVTVIDGTGGPPLPDSNVIVSEGRISAVGSAAVVSFLRDVKVVDGAGKFLIPGLADMHIHLTGAGEPMGSREFMLPLLVANGITTVRDMGGRVDLLKQLRMEVNSGKRLGPRIFFTGPYLDGDPPSFQPSIVVHDAAEAGAAVRQLRSEGVDFIKVQSRLTHEAYLAIAKESHAQNMRFVGHVPDTVSALEASGAGQASIEHLTGVLLATSTREDELRREILPDPANKLRRTVRAWQQDLLDSISQEKTESLLKEFARNHTWQVPTFPTLVHLGFLTPETDLADDPRVKYVPANLQVIWGKGRRQQLEGTDKDFAVRRGIVRRSLEVVGKMNAAGVPIMAGTDAAAPNVFPGFSLHEDLAFLVKAGLTPMQALQAATSKPAEFLERSAEQGTIALGKRADLVLLDANPLEDIRNTEKIRAVLVNGKLLERGDLDALLGGVERFATSH